MIIAGTLNPDDDGSTPDESHSTTRDSGGAEPRPTPADLFDSAATSPGDSTPAATKSQSTKQRPRVPNPRRP